MAAPEKPDDVVAARLGQALKTARINAGIGQAELARLLTAVPGYEKTIPNYVVRWEKGERRLDIEAIEAIERLLNVQPGTLFRLAGYVDDGKLVDLDTLPTMMRVMIEASIEAGLKAQTGE